MKKNKVLHVLASNSYSGAESVSIDIIDELRDIFDISYCSPEGEIRKTLENNGINFIGLNKLSYGKLKKIIKKYNPDVIHAHDFRASILMAFSGNNTYKISHIHQNPKWSKNWNLKTILYFISTLFIDKIVFVSNETYQESVYKKMISSKSEIINNYVNSKKIIEKSINNKIKDNFDIAFIGRLSDEKDPLRFIRIIHKLKLTGINPKTIMIGDGPLRKKCEELIVELNLLNDIILVGFQENPYAFLSNSKILVMTSKWEGYGLVAVEALTLGIPIITRRTGGLVDINHENVGGFFYTDEEAVLKIKELITSKDKYKTKSNNAVQRASSLSNYDIWSNKLFSLYKCNKNL